MRDEDVAECEALGLEPLRALQDGLAGSVESVTAFFDGEVAAMAGYSRTGGVWMLSGQACTRNPLLFLRMSRRVVDDFLSKQPVLFNGIDARYKGALRWARWLGFTVEAPQEVPPHGALFCPAWIRRAA